MPSPFRRFGESLDSESSALSSSRPPGRARAVFLYLSCLVGLLGSGGLSCGKPEDPDALPHSQGSPEDPDWIDLRTMVLIGGGTVKAGGTGEVVEVQPFLMDRFEVTVGEFKAFAEETGYRPSHPTSGDFWIDLFSRESLANHPMVFVSLRDAQAYARWVEKRLPTEAEWQRAAAGRKGFRHPWGTLFHPNRCNTFELGLYYTTNVGTFESGRSEDGCYDLCGNVWEWTASTLAEVRTSGLPVRGNIIKGGSYYSTRDKAESESFVIEEVSNFNSGLGFRCVRDVGPPVIRQMALGLKAPLPRQRIEATERFAKLPAVVSAKLLVSALEVEPDPVVQSKIVEALLRIRQDGGERASSGTDSLLKSRGLWRRLGIDLSGIEGMDGELDPNDFDPGADPNDVDPNRLDPEQGHLLRTLPDLVPAEAYEDPQEPAIPEPNAPENEESGGGDV